MAAISSSILTGSDQKTWQLQSLLAEFHDFEGNETLKTFTDFTHEKFLTEFGGYAVFQVTFFENHNFEAIYRTEDGDIPAQGRWAIEEDKVILQQNTGDDIMLLHPKMTGDRLKVGYTFLGSSYNIKELCFQEV